MTSENRISERYHGSHGTPESVHHERARVDWIVDQVVAGGPPGRVLDVGSSQGIVSILLARQGWSAVGSEIVPTAHEFAEQARRAEPDEVQGRLEFHLTDGTLDRFPDDAFDTVVMGEILEHLTDPVAMVAMGRRVLRPGGRIVITTALGLFVDADHQNPLLPSHLVAWLGDWFEYVDSTYLPFALGRFSHIGLTARLRTDPGDDASRAGFVAPLRDLTERCLLDVQAGNETLRLRRSAHADRDLEAAHRELARLRTPAGAADPATLARRLADLETRAALAEYDLAALKAWRPARVGIAVGESLGLRAIWQLPIRVIRALRRADPPSLPPAVDVAGLTADLLGVRRWSTHHRFPWLRIAHAGTSAPTFDSVAPHQALPPGVDADIADHADLVMVEPAQGQPPPPASAIHAARAAAVPVVLLAHTVADTAYAGFADLVVVEDADMAVEAARAAGPRVMTVDPAVDIAAANPLGWVRDPEPTLAVLAGVGTSDPHTRYLAGLGEHLVVYGGDLRPAGLGGAEYRPAPLPGDLPGIARRHRAVWLAPEALATEAEYLHQVLTVLATGTPVITPGSPRLTPLLDGSGILLASNPADVSTALDRLADHIARERIGVIGRRAVFGHHTTVHRLAAICDHFGIAHPSRDTISIVLATRRPDLVEHAIAGVAHQAHPHKELLLVLHGDGFDRAAIDRRLADLDFPTRVITASAEQRFGECLNAGVLAADGDLVTKMDDDDIYGRHHLGDLVTTLHYSRADIVGKPAAWIHLEDRDQTVFRRTWASEHEVGHVAGGTILMPRALAREMMFSRVHRSVDATLFQRVRAAGGRIFSTHPFDYVLVRHGDHTWSVDDEQFIDDAREQWPGLRLDLALTDG